MHYICRSCRQIISPVGDWKISCARRSSLLGYLDDNICFCLWRYYRPYENTTRSSFFFSCTISAWRTWISFCCSPSGYWCGVLPKNIDVLLSSNLFSRRRWLWFGAYVIVLQMFTHSIYRHWGLLLIFAWSFHEWRENFLERLQSLIDQVNLDSRKIGTQIFFRHWLRYLNLII